MMLYFNHLLLKHQYFLTCTEFKTLCITSFGEDATSQNLWLSEEERSMTKYPSILVPHEMRRLVHAHMGSSLLYVLSLKFSCQILYLVSW